MVVKPRNSILYWAGAAFPAEGLGPGRRVVAWVRGCGLRCPGCMTPELWQARGRPVRVSDAAREVLALLPGADGLTISGGEPFDQAAAVAALVRAARSVSPVEVLVYTGYDLDEIEGVDSATADLLSETDLLVAGRYVAGRTSLLPWRGSDNQLVHFLSARAERHRREAETPRTGSPRLSVQMLGGGSFRIIGIPGRGDLERAEAALAARGLTVRKSDAGL